MSTERYPNHFGNVAYVRVPVHTSYATSFFCKYEESIEIIFKTLGENVAHIHYQHASLRARALYK